MTTDRYVNLLLTFLSIYNEKVDKRIEEDILKKPNLAWFIVLLPKQVVSSILYIVLLLTRWPGDFMGT